MSRIGKKIYQIPDGVEVKVVDNQIIVKGPKGELQQATHPLVEVIIEDQTVRAAIKDQDSKEERAYWGLYGSLINNMIIGVTQGYEKQLEVNGVGYKVSLQGKKIKLSLGYSHDIEHELPEGVAAQVEGNKITISGINKQQVGQVAAEIRSYRKPEPYKGKGIKYVDEVIIRKVGKAAAKA